MRTPPAHQASRGPAWPGSVDARTPGMLPADALAAPAANASAPRSACRQGTLTKSSMKDRAVSVSFLKAHEIELQCPCPVSPSATATAMLEPPRKYGEPPSPQTPPCPVAFALFCSVIVPGSIAAIVAVADRRTAGSEP